MQNEENTKQNRFGGMMCHIVQHGVAFKKKEGKGSRKLWSLPDQLPLQLIIKTIRKLRPRALEPL